MNSSWSRQHILASVLAGVAGLPVALPAQTPADSTTRPAVGGPPIRRIATASALSTVQIGNIASVRELPDGRVLVNDAQRRRLLLMDSSLKVVEVVLDSLAEVANAYGTRPGALLAHRSDTTLFMDPASYTMLVINPVGKIARVRSIPRMQDAFYMTNPSYGLAASDASGRLVYRLQARPEPPKVAPPRGVPWFPQEPDSAFIIAIDIETRKLDTLATVRTPKSMYLIRQTMGSFGQGWSVTQMTNPVPVTDDWAVLSDGTVAVVRARDYRVEFRSPDGTWSSGPKLPYEWQRLTDEDKQRVVDSVRAQQSKQAVRNYVTAMIRWVNVYGKKEYPKNFTVPPDYTVQNGLPRGWVLPAPLKFSERYIHACAEGEEPKMLQSAGAGASTAPPTALRPPPPGGSPIVTGAPGPLSGTPSCIPSPVTIAGGNVPPPPTLREDGVLPLTDLPDYKPPIPTGGAVRADLDGNLWIRTVPVRPTPGAGPVYDVVDRKGELVDRLQVPPGYTLVGFGRGKVVYLQMRDAQGVHLARVRLR